MSTNKPSTVSMVCEIASLHIKRKRENEHVRGSYQHCRPWFGHPRDTGRTNMRPKCLGGLNQTETISQYCTHEHCEKYYMQHQQHRVKRIRKLP